MTVQQCRDFYTGCDGETTTFTTTDGEIEYDLWCPCFDANGSNSGKDIVELAVFNSTPTNKKPVIDGAADGASDLAVGIAAVVAVVATTLL